MLSYTRYQELDFTCFLSKGYTTIENWIQTVLQYDRDGMTTRELYDVRQQQNLFSNEEIKNILIIAVKNQAKHKNNRKTAVVFDNRAQFGLPRMYELKPEVEGAQTKTQVFYQMDTAITWLGDDVSDCFSRSE